MILLDGHSLTFDMCADVIFRNERVGVTEDAWRQIDKSREIVDNAVEQNNVVYGITTGFGKFSDVTISNGAAADLQLNLIRSHACGVGDPFPELISRTMLLLRANALAKGYSGVRRELLQLLLDLLNHRIHPVIPQQGSLGASGDLAPLAHLALVLIGEGEAIVDGKRLPGREALSQFGLKPIQLQAKEGLALINGTQAMTATGLVAYLQACSLADRADAIGAMTLEALQGITDAFSPNVHAVRAYPQQERVAKRILTQTTGSQLVTRQGELRVQDAYSLRCMPQVHGASHRALDYVGDTLEIEINAATDNPLIFSNDGTIISGGNFHGQPVALAMDFFKIAMSEFANMSERRIERLVNPQLNDFPGFLSPEPGLQSGLMIPQYVAASLVAENKVLAHPASVDSIPSSANQEDHVSMGTIAARHALQVVKNTSKVLAIEAICAAQALEFRGVEKAGKGTRELYDLVRQSVPPLTRDRSLSEEIERLAEQLMTI